MDSSYDTTPDDNGKDVLETTDIDVRKSEQLHLLGVKYR